MQHNQARRPIPVATVALARPLLRVVAVAPTNPGLRAVAGYRDITRGRQGVHKEAVKKERLNKEFI